jgi:hypothetical protein
MKLKLFALITALSLAVWAQQNPSTSTPDATSAPETKSCCHHAANAADTKGPASCCHHADAKDASSANAVAECCGKSKCEMKDGKSCCGGKEMASAKSCCAGKDMKACAKQCEKGGKSAANCCGSKCEHAAPASPAM